MKNLLIKLTLIAALVLACNSASAVFTDDVLTIGLYHCDVTNVDAGVVLTPDDNSSGRYSNDLILNQYGVEKEAVLGTNSPYGGSYLALSGDKPIAWSFPPDAESLEVNLAFRTGEFITNDIYTSLLWTLPVKTYLQNGTLTMLVYDAAGVAQFMVSGKVLSTDVWYSVDFVVLDGFAELVVGNDDEGYITNDFTAGIGLLLPWSGTDYIIPGWDLFDGSGIREFVGDLDEIRVAIPIPEPFTFGLIGLLGFLAIRRKYE